MKKEDILKDNEKIYRQIDFYETVSFFLGVVLYALFIVGLFWGMCYL